jgi:hypothetical protein
MTLSDEALERIDELGRRSMHGGRAILASVVLGLTSTAVGVVQVGPPLGPEPQLSHVIATARP